jgi:hypothetical protein
VAKEVIGTREPFSKLAFVVTPLLAARILEPQPWKQTPMGHNVTIPIRFLGDFMEGIAGRLLDSIWVT